MQPGIEATDMDAQNPAHDTDSKFTLVSPDEAILYLDSLAKNAAAFFSMSRSSLTRRNSALSLRSSSCCSLICWCWLPASPYSLIHLCRLAEVIPSLRHTSVTL